MPVGHQLKLARLRRDIKAKDLVQEVGIAAKYLSQIENGKAPGLSVEVLGRLCRALCTEPNVIM